MKRVMSVAFAVSVATAVRAAEFPDPAAFNPTWESAKPGTSYSTDLPTAALLGNGSLGAVNGVRRAAKVTYRDGKIMLLSGGLTVIVR